MNYSFSAVEKEIVISVDLEDWFQVENLSSKIKRSSWDNYEFRVAESTEKLLGVFSNFGIQATFFVLGWTAERCPGLIKKIADQGHEIASHGYGHQLCSELSGQALSEDLLKSKVLLENISGQKITGYRAPSFSITEELIINLKENGFVYDSSYNDFSMHDRYGKLKGDWHKSPKGFMHVKSGMIELPVTNLNFMGHVVPWGGGGYFRLLPFWIFKRGVQKILNEKGCYMFYCHPWEFDPGQPKTDGLPFFMSFRHYVNISDNLAKMESFLASFKACNFITCASLANQINEKAII